MVQNSKIIQVQIQNCVLFIKATKQCRVGNENENLEMEIHIVEVEAEITEADNLLPGTVKELAQETEHQFLTKNKEINT